MKGTITMARKQLPKYREHKASGQARVTYGGKTYYLGKYKSPKSYEKYYARMEKYLEWQNSIIEQKSGKPPTRTSACVEEITCQHLAVFFLKYSKSRQTDAWYGKYKAICNTLIEHYGDTPVENFAPVSLMFLQDMWIAQGLARSSINIYSNAVKNIFKWGNLSQYVPLATYQAIQLVPPLMLGCKAKPDKDILPVPEEIVDQTLPHLPQVMQDMVQVQLLVGGRPQDICRMKKCEIDMSNPVWIYAPPKHKTQWRGKIREITIGPKAQAILAPYLEQDNSHVFMLDDKPITPGKYYNRVKYACIKNKIPHWFPNQLRHTAGTKFRTKYGLEISQAMLGHACVNTTELYAEINRKKMIKVAKKMG
jgi:integrase